MPISLPQPVWTEGSLPAILEPYMWVEISDPRLIQSLRWPYAEVRTLRIIGQIRPPEDAAEPDHADQKAVNAAARTAREALHKNAEDAIAAAGEAGFNLCEHPEINISGTLRYDRDLGLDIPIAEARITLWFYGDGGWA